MAMILMNIRTLNERYQRVKIIAGQGESWFVQDCIQKCLNPESGVPSFSKLMLFPEW
jgi:hypothetical protein